MITFKEQHYPEIFLAGVPKSGTTYLFDMLSRHGQIQPSKPKETYFHLDSDNPFNAKNRNFAKRGYVNFFASNESKVLHMDGTPLNLYQKDLVSELYEMDEKPKGVFVLREPARRILSSYQYTSNNLSAIKNLSFPEYVDCLLNGKLQQIAKACKNQIAVYSLQSELEFSKYIIYLKKWERAVGKNNMKIILFENLKDNLSVEMSILFEFLKIDQMEKGNFEVRQNASVEIKNKFVHYYLYKMFSAVGYNVPFKSTLKKVYSKIQLVENKASDNSVDGGIEQLKAHFEPFNKELADTFDLDLSSWK